MSRTLGRIRAYQGDLDVTQIALPGGAGPGVELCGPAQNTVLEAKAVGQLAAILLDWMVEQRARDFQKKGAAHDQDNAPEG